MKTDCHWTCDDDGIYQTDCGEEFVFIDDGPKEHRFQFCCWCGKPLKAKPVRENERDKYDDDGRTVADPRDYRDGLE